MAQTSDILEKKTAGYVLQGSLEACSCGTLCPCWVGEDPDGGECFGMNAYHIDVGSVGPVDVSGMNFITVNLIPGNILAPGSWRVVHLIDERGTDEQRAAVLGVFRGEYGGPLADLFGLVGEVLGTEVVPIDHRVSGGAGQLHVPGLIEADVEPFRGRDRSVTTLRDSLFSTVPVLPGWARRRCTGWSFPPTASLGTTRAATPSRGSGSWSTGDDRIRT